MRGTFVFNLFFILLSPNSSTPISSILHKILCYQNNVPCHLPPHYQISAPPHVCWGILVGNPRAKIAEQCFWVFFSAQIYLPSFKLNNHPTYLAYDLSQIGRLGRTLKILITFTCTVLCGPSNRFFNSGLKGPFFTPKDQIPTSHFVLEPLGAPNWCVNLWLLRKIWLVLQKNSVFIL